MNRIRVAPMFAMLVASSVAPVALAAPASPAAVTAQPVQLVSDVKLEKTVGQGAAAKLVLADPKVVVPGDRLLFSTRYRNVGTKPVEHFVVTNPIPAAVVLAPDSAATLEVSVDGGKTWGPLATRSVSDGKGGMRPAQAADATHVRWTLALLVPGATGTLTYHATVR